MQIGMPPEGGEQARASDKAERGDVIMQRMADMAREDYGARGLVAMIVNDDNSFRYFQTGLTHAQTNNALAVGIHMNMQDHDRKVMAERRAEFEAAATGNQESR